MLLSVVSFLIVPLKYVLLVLVAAYCWFRWSHRELLSTAAKLPYYFPAFPIIGHAYFLLWGRAEFLRRILKMTNMAVVDDVKTVVLWCGPYPIIGVNCSDDIKVVLNSSNTIDKSDEYEFFKTGLDSGVGDFKYGILTAPGQIWKKVRKHLNPMFHPRNLHHMVPVFNQNSRELVSCLSEHVGQGPVEITPYMMKIALKTVCNHAESNGLNKKAVSRTVIEISMDLEAVSACFWQAHKERKQYMQILNLMFGLGVEIDINSPEFRDLKTMLDRLSEIIIRRILQPWLRIDSLYRFLYRKELLKFNHTLKTFTENSLWEARKNLKQNQQILQKADSNTNGLQDLNENQDNGLINVMDAFHALQRKHPEFTEADMRGEIGILYATGTDTIGSAIASCILALAQYKDIQERLYQDVNSVIGPDDDITPQDLNKLPYLEQVIKETLRWFSVVPFILRRAEKPMKLSTCTIPAGCSIAISLCGINRDPKVYKDPYKFDPEHFSPERTMDAERFTFLPFSGGPRNCIAKTYAMLLVKIMVVHLLRRYKFSTDMDISKQKKKLMVILVNEDGYKVSLQVRN